LTASSLVEFISLNIVYSPRENRKAFESGTKPPKEDHFIEVNPPNILPESCDLITVRVFS
jgi:hypothetical protein